MQYGINRAAAKVETLSSHKVDKCEYLTGKKILPSDQSRIIEQAKFNYFSVGKAFEKQKQWKTKVENNLNL